ATFARGGELHDTFADAAGDIRAANMIGDWTVLEWSSMQRIASDSAGEYDERSDAARRERAARAMLHEGARFPAQRTRFALACPTCRRRVIWSADRVRQFLDSHLDSFCVSPGAD